MDAPRQRRATPLVAEELATVPVFLTDETDLEDARVTGEHLSVNAAFVELNGCRLDAVAMVGGHLRRSRLVDCLVIGCDLTGVVLEDCSLIRVEFQGCRLSAFQAPSCRFEDVGFLSCKLDGANFRMSTWKRSDFDGCDLTDADFYAATMPESRLSSCDLTSAELSKATLTGTRLSHSSLDRLRGGEALRGVIISSDLLVPAALAVFGAMDPRDVALEASALSPHPQRREEFTRCSSCLEVLRPPSPGRTRTCRCGRLTVTGQKAGALRGLQVEPGAGWSVVRPVDRGACGR